MWAPVATTEVTRQPLHGWSCRQQLALGLVLVAVALAAAVEWYRRQPRPVFVPAGANSAGSVAVTDMPSAVDVNQARVEQLAALPGIGMALAKQIVAYREQHGPFRRIEDLRRVPGIGPRRLERLRGQVFVRESPLPETDFVPVSLAAQVKDFDRQERVEGSANRPEGKQQTVPSVKPVGRSGGSARGVDSSGSVSRIPSGQKQPPDRPINLNKASREDLMRLPGIGPVLADRILAEREANGPFRRLEDLTRIRGIKARTLEKLRPYVTVNDDYGTVSQNWD